MTECLDIARGYVAAGLSVIRVRANGTKAPLDHGWREFSERRATDAELSAWFHADIACGIGITGGPASGNLAVIDFETWPAYENWLSSLPLASQQLTRPCPLVRTAGGGVHLYVRLTDPVKGTTLAYRLVDGEEKVLIEVRANGEQVVAPGSPPQCHKSGKPYEWLRRGWLDAVTPCAPVDLAEWFEWLLAAEALNEVPRKKDVARPDTRPRDASLGKRPGDDFNARGTWEETGLFEAGWAWHRSEGDDRGFVTRPGKGDGISGSLGMVIAKDGAHELFYCFTSSGSPFAHKQSYSRFRLYAMLKHSGDWQAAARALGAAGYGEQRQPRSGPVPPSASGTGPRGANQPENHAPEGGPVPPIGSGSSPPPNAPNGKGARPPLPLTYYADIRPALDAADFVEGLLIDGAMSVIYGESGCGKTFFTLDLALHVAAGMPWRGREVDQRGVLYLALEGSHGINNRVAAFQLANALNATDFPFAVVPVALNLLASDGDTMRVIEAAQVAAAHLGIKVGLIVVDTLSRAMAGGNENASEDMGALVGNVDVIRQALPSHVAVVHHSGKDGAKGARGHSLLRAATDTEIEVSRGFGSKTSLAKVTKQRELDLEGEFAFRLVPVELGVNRRGKAVTSCVVREVDADGQPTKEDREQQKERAKLAKERERDAEDDQAVMVAVLKAGEPGSSKSRIEDLAPVSKARVAAAIVRLAERGRLVEAKDFYVSSGNGAKTFVKLGYAPQEGYQGAEDR